MLSNAFESLHVWAWLSAHIAGMRPLVDQLASADPKTFRLEQSDEIDWMNLWFAVDRMIWRPMRNLQITVPRSHGLRPSLIPAHDSQTCKLKSRCPTPHGCESEWNMKRSSSPTVQRVMRNFNILSGRNQEMLGLHGLRPMVQETHYMVERDAAANALIDNWILTDFFELAVFADLQHCAEMLHPHSKLGGCHTGEMQKAFDDFMVSAGLLSATTDGSKEALSLGDPLDGRFNYPIEKRRTAETVKQMQCAETALEAYWAELG